jgi:hypothetical protein
VRLYPLTGRSHQLRVHMKEIGHPILGDPFYATGPARDFPRLMLHAESLKLRHPDGGKGMLFRAPVPVLTPFILAKTPEVWRQSLHARGGAAPGGGPTPRAPPHSQPDTALISRNSCRPNTPPSRPFPDCLNPPKGEPWPKPLPLPSTMPDRTRRATRRSFSWSLVWM